MTEYGFIYASTQEVNSLKPRYAPISIPKMKFLNYKLKGHYTLYGPNIIIQRYDSCVIGRCSTQHRWIYMSVYNGIDDFIRNRSNIKKDTLQHLSNIEEEYDIEYDFWTDYYDRLENMGICNPNCCFEIQKN
jgi:hypothetical protein